MIKKVLLSIALLSAVAFGQAVQPGSTTVQTAQPLISCTPVNGTAAAGSQATLTIPAPNGASGAVFIYITQIDIEINTSAATAASTVVTSTNVGSPSIQWAIGLTAAAGAVNSLVLTYPVPMKSLLQSTKVTIVGPTGVAGMTQNFNACYYYGS